MAWPPTLPELKNDKKLDAESPEFDRDDESLQRNLDAAIDYVEDKLGDKYDFDIEESPSVSPSPSELLVPTKNIKLGTLRLAGRWYDRSRSPGGSIEFTEAGTTIIPFVDPDIARMLGIGKYHQEGAFA